MCSLRTMPVLALCCLVHAGARSQEARGGEDERGRLAAEALREATGILKLRKTSLRECAPEYHVPAVEGLKWKDALKHASAHFKNDKVRRALFLRKYLADGQSMAELAELELTTTGGSCGTGSGFSWTYMVVPGKESEAKPFGFVEPRVTIGVWLTHGKWDAARRTHDTRTSVLMGTPWLGLREVKVRGVTFTSLTFDASDRLVGFTLSRKDADRGISYVVGGNTSGEDDSNFYYATFSGPEGRGGFESLNYDEDLLLKYRSVRDPKTMRTLYADTYVAGVPHKRRHYEHTERRSIIARTERFPLPQRPMTREAMQKAFEQLADENPRTRRRARQRLILAGPGAVAEIRARFPEASEELQLECVEVLEGIGSAEAADVLIPLLDHKSEKVTSKAGDALGRVGRSCQGAVVRAYESPGATKRLRRWCLLVLGKVKDPEMLPFVEEALEDDDACGCAAMVLRWYGTPEAEAILRKAATSALAKTRERAQEELKSIERRRATERR